LDRDGVLLYFDIETSIRFFEPRVPLSIWEISARWEAWGERHGFPRTMAEEEGFFASFWDSLCDELGLSDEVRSDLHNFDYTSCMLVYPDVLPALRMLREAKLRIGVLSNFALASLEKSLETAGLAEWIDVACAATVIGVSKPDRAAYMISAQRLGVAPDQCLFLDDEPPCVAGAAAIGMHAYLVDRSLPAHDIAAHKVSDLSALPALLSQFNLS
jgi:putative hydrolase of the HAD superfamily